MSLLPSFETLAIALPTALVAYTIFGMAGFGSTLFAAPILAHAMPISFIVPLLAILDCAASMTAGVRLGTKVSRPELYRIVPLMVVGVVIGTYLLLVTPERPMALALGVFVTCYAVYSLAAPVPTALLHRGWVVPFGIGGGIFSAMFGSGGAAYAMYLGRRLDDKDAFRATQGALIGLSTFTRVVIFAFAGIYNGNPSLIVLALVLLPVMSAGMWIGHRITMRLTREQFLRILYILLICSGSSLILRAMLSAG